MSAEQIRDLRLRLGWTQLDLANEIGTTSTTVSRWERGQAKPQGAALKTLRRLEQGREQ